MSRKKVDLKILPVHFQYAISLVVIAIVVIFAWFAGRNQPIPDWITTSLVPALGWGYLILFVYAIASKVFQK